MGRAGAQRGASADDVAAAAGDDPLHANDAVRGAAQGPAAAGAARILELAAHGGLTGVPQVSVPGTSVAGLPVGLSIVGGAHVSAMSAPPPRRWTYTPCSPSRGQPPGEMADAARRAEQAGPARIPVAGPTLPG